MSATAHGEGQSVKMTNPTVPGTDPEPADLALPRESADIADFAKPKWALMALDPRGKRQLLVKKLTSGITSHAMVFRELECNGNNERRLSVAKWNKEPYAAAKMARTDREVRVARLLAGSGRAERFAKLLAAQDMEGGYRESWWNFYNLGDMHDLVAMAFRFCEPQPPLSLVFRSVAQCLEGIQCLNQGLDVRHMDLHPGNIFFHLAEDALYPDAVIGDFGYSRFKGERPPKFSTAELGEMSSRDKEVFLSPPLNSDEAFKKEDYSWRLRMDLHHFQNKGKDVLTDKFKGAEKMNEILYIFFNRMRKVSAQDEEDRKVPASERPPIQDLTELINDAWAYYRAYAETTADKVAMAQVREKLLSFLRPQSSEPRVFDDEQEAREAFGKFIDAGMLRPVNLLDDESIDAAAKELASFKIQDSAYVSDRSDTGSTSGRGSTSGSGRQAASASTTSSKSKDASTTRWSPAARGQAEAEAFAMGDPSAVEGILAARAEAERAVAKIREQRARLKRRGRKAVP